MKATYRKVIYYALLVVSVATAVCIVAGVFTQAQVYSVVDIATSLFAAFASVLALVNITPDD